MIWLVVAVVWAVQSYAAYHLFEATWLRTLDLERRDRRALIGMSLLPVSFIVASFVYWTERPPSDRSSEILKERRR